METIGCHILTELSSCNPETLGNVKKVRELMMQAALEANAEIRETAFHQFSPCGVSGVVVIAESHLSIHTWPEYGYAAIDIYTCGQTTSPLKACQYLAEKFSAGKIFMTKMERGILDKRGNFMHRPGEIIEQKEVYKHAENKELAMV